MVMDDTTIEIAQMDLIEAFNVFKVIYEGKDEMIYKTFKYGLKKGCKFNITHYWKGRPFVISKPKKKLIFIDGIKFKIDEVETEIERRERLLKRFLIENSNRIQEITRGRKLINLSVLNDISLGETKR